MRTNETCRMSPGEAAARFVMALFDPRLSSEQKNRLIEGWNDYARKRSEKK